jgi:hypothetical protein
MARSGGAELRQDSRPEPPEADCPVLAQEVLLRHLARAGYHRALLVFRATAQVARSAFLAEPAATLRPVERWVWGLMAEERFALGPRQAASGRAVEQRGAPLVSAHLVFVEAAGSAVTAR